MKFRCRARLEIESSLSNEQEERQSLAVGFPRNGREAFTFETLTEALHIQILKLELLLGMGVNTEIPT